MAVERLSDIILTHILLRKRLRFQLSPCARDLRAYEVRKDQREKYFQPQPLRVCVCARICTLYSFLASRLLSHTPDDIICLFVLALLHTLYLPVCLILGLFSHTCYLVPVFLLMIHSSLTYSRCFQWHPVNLVRWTVTCF